MKLKKGIYNLRLLTAITVVMFVIQLINVNVHYGLTQFGILPRDIYTLPQIFTAPFIHGNWMHLLNNVIGFWIFSLLCLLRGRQFYLRSSVFIIVVSGVLDWCFARKAWHIGASGWIFGLWSLAIAGAYCQRRFLNLTIALVVVFFYGGMIFGVLPNDASVSFEGHIFGAISGVLAAYIYRNTNR